MDEKSETNFYNFVSAPVAATRNPLTERLQSVCEIASLSYTRMTDNIENGQERLKDTVKKEGRDEELPKSVQALMVILIQSDRIPRRKSRTSQRKYSLHM